MKFLFIVQGEGRGHLTQAITLEEILRRNGHEVVEVLVGKSSSRRLPGFFINFHTTTTPFTFLIIPNMIKLIISAYNIIFSILFHLQFLSITQQTYIFPIK